MAEPPPPAPPTPEAERRQLTVVFCDLADSTRLSSQLDPEDLRDVIRAYQSTSAEVIERYGGYIAQHLGDGLMVYFGWPQAHEDDPQRAVHAGLGILDAMSGLNARLEQDKGIRLAVRIGIHTGLVVVGEIGQGVSQEHLALGETPNLAARIEGVAKPDTVAISEATYQLVQGYVVCNDLGPHAMKGIDAPQHVYQVVKERDTQSRLDEAAARQRTPLVGRESECALLFDRWRQVKEGQGQVVLLSGEAGIGKSRLLQVMREHVADETHTLLECRSSPYYQNTALYPITDMLQRLLIWQQEDTPAVKLAKLEQTLSQYHLELDKATPLFAHLLLLTIPEDRHPPLNISPQQQRQRTLAMIVAMLLQQAEQQPVLLILEDLHWTDPSTLELLDLLIDQIPTIAICVLLTCRPAFQPSWGSRSYLSQLTLNRLSRQQIEAIAKRVAGGNPLPGGVLKQIVEKTDGVPLFVEEMTKAVLESGALKQVNGQYETVGSLASLAIPATLQDSLMARLDRLVTAKAVAQYAAVIGRQFSYQLLRAVSQLDNVTLQRELARLVEAELVYQRGVQPHATYTFKHALVVEAAYASLLKGTRQQYHQRIAQVLEAEFPETAENQPELLAHHYTEAGFNVQAIAYWHRSGQRASERSANQEVINHLMKGLGLLATLPDTAERTQYELDLQIALAPALMAIKGMGAPEVEQAYTRAQELCQQVGETPQTFPVLWGLRTFYNTRGELHKARALGEQGLILAQRQHDATRMLEAYTALGNTSYYLGEFSAAHTHLEQGITLYNPQQHSHLAYHGSGLDQGVMCLSIGAHVLWYLGYPDKALRQSHKGCLLAEEVAHPFSLAAALAWAARLHQNFRQVQATHERAVAVINLSTEQGFPQWLAQGMVLQGWALAKMGQGEEGLTQIHQGLDAWRATGAEVGRQWRLLLLAEAYATIGQTTQALETLVEALAVVEATGDRRDEAALHRLTGELLLRQAVSDVPQATTRFHQALDIARRQQAKSLELRAATSLARLWQQQGKRQAAYELLQPVYSWFTEGFDTADLKEGKELLDELG